MLSSGLDKQQTHRIARSVAEAALCLSELGKTAEAMGLHDGALRMLSAHRKIRDNHAPVLSARFVQVQLLRKAGRKKEAVERGRKLRAEQEEVLGVFHPDVTATEELLEKLERRRRSLR